MGTGIRAELVVDPADSCPVVRAARSVDANASAVTTSVSPEEPSRVTEEFTLETGERTPEADVELTEVFDYGTTSAYRFQRALGEGCPCECVERFDCPVVDVRTRDGMLHLVFHASDIETLQAIIGDLREAYPTVDVQRLLQSAHDRPDHTLVYVDRGRLTDRQLEVLETAHRMGYFDHPKGANAGEVAAELDISAATFSEHLSAAQSKLLDSILDG